ncbi:MAG TPA: TlpA disulfide reductase family protein [Bryobacteraceae bacterium]|nr:TlpA disulfide reductase family protein [Bryobacteraceae bacterium]
MLGSALLAACLYAAPQNRPKPAAPSQSASQESQDLETALSEAGSSPIEYLRAIEKHLAKYPNSPRRAELERAAVRAAMEANDDAHIVEYGERVLARQPDDLQILERVIRSLLALDGPETVSPQHAQRALQYATHYEQLLRRMQREGGQGMSAAEWKDQTDRAIARTLSYEARATGNLGHPQEALALAQRAFETCPTAETAREIARWDERLGKPEDAARALADAFTIPDPHTTDADRARDRSRMGELYRQAHGFESGLGDMLLQAYDRNLALVHSRELQLRSGDPNAELTDPMQFTLTAVEGGPLKMPALKGKVVVFDFWATWCGPCRQQHPLYEQVQARFRGNPSVVFLSIDTDEDRKLVKPFLAEVKWQGPVYFEDGLSRALHITTIPTTVIANPRGQVAGRMNGFVPERFVEMLTERIRDALAEGPKP